MSKENGGKIRIGLARQEEREKAVAFVNAAILKWHKCTPPPCPKVLFIARRGDDIVGTMSLVFSDGNAPFPLETIYRFDYARMPFPFDRRRVVQFGRWISAVPDVSVAMIYASTLYAIRQGCEFGMTEVKPKIAERLGEIGVNLRFIEGTELILENVPEYGRSYYTIPPSPLPCMMDLREKIRSLEGLIEKIIADGKIVFDENVSPG